MTLLTLFTAPKPFTNPHIAKIQRNAIRSWIQLGPDVEVLLIGEEAGLAETAAELGLCHLRHVERNSYGTPLVNSMFELARKHGTGSLLCCINADVILLPDVLEAARQVANQASEFLIVGQRWDLAVTESLDFSAGWQDRLWERLKRDGRLHPRGGSDYFIFRRESYLGIPPLAIGRAGWDNWMIYEERRRGGLVVDATDAVNIIHQDHDYSHLPNGQPHYRLPETFENVRLGGGKLTIFKLDDANQLLGKDGKLHPLPQTRKKFWREVEIFPLIKLKSKALAWLLFAVFHPKKAYQEFRKSMDKKNADL